MNERDEDAVIWRLHDRIPGPDAQPEQQRKAEEFPDQEGENGPTQRCPIAPDFHVTVILRGGRKLAREG